MMMARRRGGGSGSGSRAMVAVAACCSPLLLSASRLCVRAAAGRSRRVRVGVLNRCCRLPNFKLWFQGEKRVG